jgi:hypothetical protein
MWLITCCDFDLDLAWWLAGRCSLVSDSVLWLLFEFAFREVVAAKVESGIDLQNDQFLCSRPVPYLVGIATNICDHLARCSHESRGCPKNIQCHFYSCLIEMDPIPSIVWNANPWDNSSQLSDYEEWLNCLITPGWYWYSRLVQVLCFKTNCVEYFVIPNGGETFRPVNKL